MTVDQVLSDLQASPRPCLNVHVKILRGRNITLGWHDWVDAPDPFVTLSIPSAPDGKKQTKHVDNNANPEWNQTFEFIIDPELKNTLTLRLWDADYIANDPIGSPVKLPLKHLEIGKAVSKTVKFEPSGAEIDLEYLAYDISTDSDLRHGSELCDEEVSFLQKRKSNVFNAMTQLLGSNGPRTIEEAPTLAVLGSGGGYRAMACFSATVKALAEAKVLDCSTYMSGLSGSAWYVSMLYSMGTYGVINPEETQKEIREKISWNPLWFLRPSRMHIYNAAMEAKKLSGQPISFTDLFGHFIGGHLLGDKKDVLTLSEQRVVVRNGKTPLPINTSLHVKKDVSAQVFADWVEYTPYEIGMAKYGTFMKSELFNSLFFCGKLVKKYPESPLHYLQGIWGSAFTILLQRLRGGSSTKQINDMKKTKGDGREELQEHITNELHVEDSDDDEDEDEDKDLEMIKEELKTQKEAVASGKDSPEAKMPQKEDKPEDVEEPGFWTGLLDSMLEMFPKLQTREGRAGIIHNFLRGLGFPQAEATKQLAEKQTVKKRKIMMVDAGLEFNSPYPAVLRTQRNVDVFLSFDYSARESDNELPFKELKLAAEWAKRNNMPFPPINAEEQFEKEGWKECYVFKDPSDPACPIVLHFVLVNKTFRKFKEPGVERKTDEEKKAGDFPIFDDPDGTYSTFNFEMANEDFDRLCALVEFNTKLSLDTIKDSLAESVQRKRQTLTGN